MFSRFNRKNSERRWIVLGVLFILCSVGCPRGDVGQACFSNAECREGLTCEIGVCRVSIPKCVAGTHNDCQSDKKTWTGELCCVSGVSQCVAGTHNDCQGDKKTWTGQLCCISP